VQIPILIEKVLLAVTLFSGFTYLRRRSHAVDPEANMHLVLMALFAVLPAFLVLEAKVLPLLPLKGYPLLALKVSLLIATFWGIGRWLLKTKSRVALAEQPPEAHS
jgi:hypothetical protein